MTTAEKLLVAEGLSVSLGGREILHGLDLTLHAGEVVGLIGPNGAGKSTLLAVLAGDTHPSAGRVQLLGRGYRDYSAREAARARAVMLQDPTVSFAHLVRDVVEMGRAAWSSDQEISRDIVDTCLAEVGMDHMQHREITTLSGGERARVALARVMAQRARCVMLDEPTAAMDIGHQERTMHSARRIAAGGDGVIVVLHDLNLAARYCDRLALLDGGHLAAVGTPAEVCTTERLSEVYRWPVSVSRAQGELWIRPTPGAAQPDNQPFG
ncbi:heme ABC transporter ATP-binding protein [Corynebacterium terpenotabidum]|uniref:Iron ABC transport system ATP-binding protein n=1 Tax=Corynebacterium terpenotabidum Y-11 TaxID=1200352 RepID=S4XFV2_9CORY|nr:heme ABC transporter ATP-binding protein [Corynebacterium terpenotabidum]AGP30520.1 iron ABC transport system ATP-binding protein [Corynebacterium terpenotabidum Y-11]